MIYVAVAMAVAIWIASLRWAASRSFEAGRLEMDKKAANHYNAIIEQRCNDLKAEQDTSFERLCQITDLNKSLDAAHTLNDDYRQELAARRQLDSKLWLELTSPVVSNPAWPRVWSSDVWVKDLEPAYKQMLAKTMQALIAANDTELITQLRIRAWVLTELINQPRLAVERLKMIAENEHQTGRAGGQDAK